MRRPDQRPGLLAACRLRLRLGLEEIAVEHDKALELAAATGLTAYDASYLWLARELGAELVTLDRRLANAARRSERHLARLLLDPATPFGRASPPQLCGPTSAAVGLRAGRGQVGVQIRSQSSES
jgi:hypothetical protein